MIAIVLARVASGFSLVVAVESKVRRREIAWVLGVLLISVGVDCEVPGDQA